MWRKCTTCKKPINFGQKYWICSVSTCNRIRTDLVFCDLRCFDAHVPVMNHRDAGAFEKRAPSEAEARNAAAPAPPKSSSSPASMNRQSADTQSPSSSGSSDIQNDILVVVSKLKAYIRTTSGMNTSDSVSELLSRKIRIMADRAIENAKKSGRQTVLDRDV